MKARDAVKTRNHGRDDGRRIGQAAVGLVSRQRLRAALVVSLTAIIFVSPAQAQPPLSPEKLALVCAPEKPLIDIPEVKSRDGKLRAVLMLSDEERGMWDNNGRCESQHLRYFKGWNADDYWNAAQPPPPWPSDGQPIPGPTLRARIGDRIEISFINQINYTVRYPMSLDSGEGGCDKTRSDLPDPNDPKKTITVDIYPRNDTMPNCLHGSSTTNVHFHGTHTTPSTTGDNVLLYIRPASRVKVEGQSHPQIQPTDAVVKANFDEVFKSCEKDGSPTAWNQLPATWQAEQQRLLTEYDATAPYKGTGKLPEHMKLWPKNEKAIKAGLWPQYSVGAFPYCFRVPDYKDYEEHKVKMAQAPGTHWYHAHKHGSTALNVGNGMTGAFIIEGPYDDELRKYYNDKGQTLKEKVLVIQQLQTSLNMLSPAAFPAPPFLSVNGRREPVIEMQPGQVQMWRIVNGAARSFVQFRSFTRVGGRMATSDTVEWRQTAQDGVQFHPDNYETVGKKNAAFNMAAANRVDLLVKAPETPGKYTLQVVDSVLASPPEASTRVTLLTVNVTGEVTPMEFIDRESFPKFPDFLKNIPKEKVSHERKLVFNTTPAPGRKPLTGPDPVLPSHTINGKLFTNAVIDQTMGLDTVEEWTLVNKAVGIAHPFHIHINPFQVVEVFDPDSPEAKEGGNCYADPKKPETWKPCEALPAPFVWWDVRAIPSARPETFDCDACPSGSGDACSFAGGKCTVKIPGYFKMRSRFADFPGVFVQHCHILAHEDRGMMELIQISKVPSFSPKVSGYRHD